MRAGVSECVRRLASERARACARKSTSFLAQEYTETNAENSLNRREGRGGGAGVEESNVANPGASRSGGEAAR